MLTTMTNDELQKEWTRVLSLARYYGAAEGNWRRETADREANDKRFKEVEVELSRRGITGDR